MTFGLLFPHPKTFRRNCRITNRNMTAKISLQIFGRNFLVQLTGCNSATTSSTLESNLKKMGIVKKLTRYETGGKRLFAFTHWRQFPSLWLILWLHQNSILQQTEKSGKQEKKMKMKKRLKFHQKIQGLYIGKKP